MEIYRTTFSISKMDCPSEENLIRLKLDGFKNIQLLHFDLKNRKLEIYHSEDFHPILSELERLNLDVKWIDSVRVERNVHSYSQDKRILWIVLMINFSFFLIELLTGFLSRSMGLVADSLDMFADSAVYGLALLAVSGTIFFKKRISKIAGFLQLTLAFLGLIEVTRRFVGFENVPDFMTMMVISTLALIGNALCLYLLQKSKNKEAHMQASIIFTSNDVIINFGVILSGALVYLSNSKYPDLVIGTIVFLIVCRGAVRILKLSV